MSLLTKGSEAVGLLSAVMWLGFCHLKGAFVTVWGESPSGRNFNSGSLPPLPRYRSSMAQAWCPLARHWPPLARLSGWEPASKQTFAVRSLKALFCSSFELCFFIILSFFFLLHSFCQINWSAVVCCLLFCYFPKPLDWIAKTYDRLHRNKKNNSEMMKKQKAFQFKDCINIMHNNVVLDHLFILLANAFMKCNLHLSITLGQVAPRASLS